MELPDRPWTSPAWLATGLAIGLAAALRPVPQADLSGQIAVVTGASRGLGLLLPRELGRAGCHLAICARDEGELNRARTDLEARGFTVFTARCDVANRRDVEGFIGATVQRFGGVDLLVNNAGL